VDFDDLASEISESQASQISYGNRQSKFGFTDMFGLSKGGGEPPKKQEKKGKAQGSMLF